MSGLRASLRQGGLVVTWSNLDWIICHEMLLPECPFLDFSVAYYNSKQQVKAMLARVQGLISEVTARDWREPVPQLSQLALACRYGKPRAIRNRFAP